MPELPEVETIRRGLAPVMEGFAIDRVDLRRAGLRRPFPPRFVGRLAGRRVMRLDRRGKYLLAFLDSGEVLVVHLGMSGSFRIESEAGAGTPGRLYRSPARPGVHDHVVFHMNSGVRLVFSDPRRFGLMDLVAARDLPALRQIKDLGLEPLDGALDGATIARLFRNRAAPLKSALMDQRLIAGLGNIYVCEVLWRAGLSPTRPAASIASASGSPKPAADRLASAIRTVLNEAIAAGGSSFRDYVRTNGELGMFQHEFAVYDREGEACRRRGCKGKIRRMVQSGRSTFFCPVCQR